MKGKTLDAIIKEYGPSLLGDESMVLVLQDTDKDLSILFGVDGRLAFQFQDDWCPIVYPVMTYRGLGFKNKIEALKMLKRRSIQRIPDAIAYHQKQKLDKTNQK